LKKIYYLLMILCLNLMLQALVLKTVNVTACGLSSSITPTEKNTITNLTLTGTIDARDFKTLRDKMPELAYLDIKKATISAFSGTDITASGSYNYPADEIPILSARDIMDFLFFKFYKEMTEERLLSQLKECHIKRQYDIDLCYSKQ